MVVFSASSACAFFLVGVSALIVSISYEYVTHLGYSHENRRVEQIKSPLINAFYYHAFLSLHFIITSYRAVASKLSLFTYAIIFMLLSNENGKKKNVRPQTLTPNNSNIISTKTIYFLRHGESMWNLGINRGVNLSLIPRFLYLFYWELRVLLKRDSVFLDSPLSELGVQQSIDANKAILSGTIPSEDLHAINNTALLVSSNLRRAISTLFLALNHRFTKEQTQRVQILSDLQEITRNVDGISMCLPGGNSLSEKERTSKTMKREKISNSLEILYRKNMDLMSCNGNKLLRSRFVQRARDFLFWAFTNPIAASNSHIIVAGHSLFFKKLFKEYLPESFSHAIKEKKISNGGMVKAQVYFLEKNGYRDFYIVPESITVLTGHIGSPSTKTH